jgi:hypothetical protein
VNEGKQKALHNITGKMQRHSHCTGSSHALVQFSSLYILMAKVSALLFCHVQTVKSPFAPPLFIQGIFHGISSLLQ